MQAYGKAADVFSFGVVLWELVTLGVPWHDEGEDHDGGGGGAGPGGAKLQYYVIANVPQGDRLEFPPHASLQPPLPEAPAVRSPAFCVCEDSSI